MRRAIALACCLFITSACARDEAAQEALFPSTPEQVATLRSEPSYLIGGLISPLSGQPVLRKTDLVVKGAQPIVLSRTYIPSYMPCAFERHKHNQEEWDKYHLYQQVAHHYKGWQFYPHLKCQLTLSSMRVLLTDPHGMSLAFHLSGSEATLSSSDGLTNAVGDTPSGKYDPRNTRIAYEEDGNQITVYAPDGTIRLYHRKNWITPTDQLYLMSKEILPNGKVLRYHYNEAGQPDGVESLDPQERFVYASLRIQGSPWEGSCQFTASSGLTASYNYQKRPIYVKIKERVKHWYGDDKHRMQCHFTCPPILTSVSSPLYRQESLEYCDHFLLSAYSGKEELFQCHHAGFGSGTPHYRVSALCLPVGPQDAWAPVYELSYQPPLTGQNGGTTTVNNSDGISIVYHFSKNLLLTAMQCFGQDGALKKETLFSWDERHWLRAIVLKDGQGHLLYSKSYAYDAFGNPTQETFTGDLTGGGEQETSLTQRTFSQDGRNLLLREEREDGTVFCFSYLPHTNLLTSKLTQDKDRILLREVRTYDDSHNLIQIMSDDGSQKTLTTYRLRQSQPFLHMPEWIEESYWEGSEEKRLKQTHLTYDPHGNVAQEAIYDANGHLAYTLYKTYDARGELLSETNALGQQALTTYDAKGRPETATSFSHRLHTLYHHDARGRLCKRTEIGDDGTTHTTASEYDTQDREIHKQDPFHNSSHYTYDPISGAIARADLPAILALDGQAIPVSTHATSDPLGRKLTQTDPNGHTTTYRYNAYGSPTEITHPDGSQEHVRYYKNGQLASHTDADGLTLCYTRDVLGRVLSKTYSKGEELAQERFTYSGSHLLTETDKEGRLTRYFYDGAGRRSRKEDCGRVTEYAYDPLGRLAVTTRHNGDQTLVIEYVRDLLDRIVEENHKDASGQLLYKIARSYDEAGNPKTITRWMQGQEAVETFAYDPFHRVIEHEDALGNTERTSYLETPINALGQRVLRITKIDPQNVARVDTYDALSRLVKEDTLTSEGQTIASRENLYDPQGNLTLRKEHVFVNGQLQTTHLLSHSYTSTHQLESVTRASGSPEARRTLYTYTPAGKRATKVSADGTTLTYEYDPLGFCRVLRSSDGRVHHVFVHNKEGHLLLAQDEHLHLAIRREVDPFGNVTCEAFPNGLCVQKTYDAFDRPTLLHMGEAGQVHYHYDPLALRSAVRLSAKGDILYVHQWEEYDVNGNLTKESLPFGLGSTLHTVDRLGREIARSNPYFSQTCTYDSVGNLISQWIDGQEHHYTYDGLSQLTHEDQSLSYQHDSLHQLVQKNGQIAPSNVLHELSSLGSTRCSYDLNGNTILKQTPEEKVRFMYDPLNQLIEAASDTQRMQCTYDPLGRRLTKVVHLATDHGWQEATQEQYLYDGLHEIGAFTTDLQPKTLRVLTPSARHPTPIAIESEGQCFVPLLDAQGNVRHVLDPLSKSVSGNDDFTAFGEGASPQLSCNPWRYASKRLDPEFRLIYFGKRYYDPELGRWLTTDPAGCMDSINLYQYALNNPLRYFDPHGENILGFVLGIGEILLGGAIMATGVALEVATFGGYTFALGLHESAGLALMSHGCVHAMYHSGDIALEKRSTRPDADPRAEGSPHTIIEKPGSAGQYTTHNGDGTFKQYRGSGKPHGDIARPNVKETKNNLSPTGHRAGKPEVRKPTPDEIPTGK